MGPGMGGHPPSNNDKLKEPLPKSIRELPRYVKNVTVSFFSRLIYIFRLIYETRPWILFAMLFISVISGLLPVLSAYITASLLNSLVSAYTEGTARFPDILSLVALQFVYFFVNRVVSNVNVMITRISGELVGNHIRIKIMNKAKEIDLASFDKPDFYERLENANREAGMRPIQIINATFSAISLVISMVSFIAILWTLSPVAPFIILLLSVPSAIINFVYRKKNVLYMRHRSKDRRQLNYYSGLLTNKDMVKEIRIFGLSDSLITRYGGIFEKYFSGMKKLFLQEGCWHIGTGFVTSAVSCLLFLYVAYKVCLGELLVGDYSLYTGALNAVASGVAAFIAATSTIYEGTLFIDNMIMFMNEKTTVIPSIPEPVHPRHGSGHDIEFKNVSFRYPGTGRDVLKNINLTLHAGESVMIVGLNGAGKTTLVKLLTRLYDPTEGAVLLDGRDIREYSLSELYSLFGIIFQDFGKYAEKASDNIAFGEITAEPTAERIKNAAVMGNADDFIEKLPNGYDTPLMRIFEENGIELSIGQWQKLAVSRAFYRNSDILILDEPTASLDAVAEQEIFTQFDLLRKNKTTVFISHRLSSATVVSRVIVLEDGKITEQGTHSELMSLGGHYYKLFSTQAKRYLEGKKKPL